MPTVICKSAASIDVQLTAWFPLVLVEK